MAPQVSPPEAVCPTTVVHRVRKTAGEPGKFRLAIDESLQRQNIYYRDLIAGHILQPLRIRLGRRIRSSPHAQRKLLGGQNKGAAPRFERPGTC